jgi:hypothetical protein
MSTTQKLAAGEAIPAMVVAKAGGGEISIGSTGCWQMVVIYRGKHCPEPGLFVINPQGPAHIVDISNAPFAPPDLKGVLNGLKFIRKRGYPIRGTAA